MTRPYLSVSELARACAPIDSAGEVDANRLSLWTRRLRHWTVLGILPSSTRHGDGAGKHRLYRPELVYQASVLLRLAGVGLPFPVIRLIADELLKETADNGELWSFWRDAIKSEQSRLEYFLAIWIIDEGEYVFIDGIIGKRRTINIGNIGIDDFPAILLDLNYIFKFVNGIVKPLE
jgi:DNA-binding transcriptional MerR regulator